MKNRSPIRGLIIYFQFALFIFFFTPVTSLPCSSQSRDNVAGYPELIQQADLALAAKDYPTALLLYTKAGHAKPENNYAPGKIKGINTILDDNLDTRPRLFENLIINAENLFTGKNYALARTEYQKALLIDPKAQFPKDRLGQISAVYSDPADEAYFNESVTSGDRALALSEYEKAIMFYETALAVKPDSRTVKDKITNSRKQQAEYKVKVDQTAKITAAADKLLQTEKYAEARAEYQKVLEIMADNQYALQKTKEIDKHFSDLKEEQEAFDKLIGQADQFYINRDFASAHRKYQEALKVKPGARYPKDMLEKTKSGQSELQSEQQKYDAALASAENFLKDRDYDEALTSYKSALTIKPEESYPKTKIFEIEKIIKERSTRREAYEIAIKNGDQSFSEKKYDPALSHYHNALTLLPDEQYPAQKIEEINALIESRKSLDAKYMNAITDADNLFNQNKFNDAISVYSKALVLKPEESYPQQRINEAQVKLTASKNKEENYAAAIESGDKSLAEQKYEEALSSYKQALSLKPAEKYPKDKTEEINQILSKLKADNNTYTQAIANGDKAMNSGDYKLALSSYQDALIVKPAEQYPKEKIDLIKAELATQEKNNENYNAAVSKGDRFFESKEYDRAIEAYNQATESKKNEKYPQDQITKINSILADLHSADENYSKAVTDADNFFNQQKYNEAGISYKKALQIKPSETYPNAQLEKINVFLAEQKKTDSDYTNLIGSAEKFFNSKNYPEAIVDFRKALALKPLEKYPADKIAEAEKLIADLKSLQESFDKAIADGDKYLSEKDYVNSLESFNAASLLKPAEAYPKQKIAEVQAILDKDKAEGQRYSEALSQADKFFTDQKYREAIELYQRASAIKPLEKYPEEQVRRINQLLDEQKKLDEDYQKLISDAQVQMNDKKYAEARNLFSSAGTLKPSEKLPGNKIAEIDGILADLQQKEQSYTRHISEGDAFFADRKYTEAIASYTNAKAIKPAEIYPKTQVEKINDLVAAQKKLDDNFLEILRAADISFGEKKYTEAITEYRKAMALKPSDKYPADKIAEAEKQIADLKALQDAYNKAIADGDKKLAVKEYENALISFKKANSVYPEESYPTQKITEIQVIIDKQKAENDRYQEAIALADKFFTSGKYRDALEPYQRAATIKPAEKYPAEQIAITNELLAKQSKLDEDYEKLISDGEIQLKAEKYIEARELFSNAGTMKPSEKLPKDKIAGIDSLLANLKQKDENYTKVLNTASGLYNSKNLAAAIKSYEEAQAIKPSETYPQERITAISSELKAIDDKYTKAVILGDEKLASKNLMEALNAYQNALEIKPGEEYPKLKIEAINSTLSAQKEEQEKLYGSYIADGDRLFETKDYYGARSAFTKATGIKPAETYPAQKIIQINKIIAENELAIKAQYNKALGEADKLYNTKIFDQAIDAYETASAINPGDTYPSQQIEKIRKYMADHAIQDLFSQTLLISEGNEKKFTFSPIELRLRKNNYILLKARSTGNTAPKVYLNYGRDGQKNGGIVLRSLDKATISDYLIRISVQDKWYREDNNWISLFVETGDIEITKVQIAAGDD